MWGWAWSHILSRLLIIISELVTNHMPTEAPQCQPARHLDKLKLFGIQWPRVLQDVRNLVDLRLPAQQLTSHLTANALLTQTQTLFRRALPSYMSCPQQNKPVSVQQDRLPAHSFWPFMSMPAAARGPSASTSQGVCSHFARPLLLLAGPLSPAL